MKIAQKILISLLAFGTFPILSVHAGNAVVLESFENGFTTNSQGKTNIAQFTAYGNLRNNTPVSISLYTSAGPGDPRVTDGTHSIKVVFPVDGFGNDIGVALSDAACAMLESAAASNQTARYIFRYDVILEDVTNVVYFNQHFLIVNAWDYLRSGGGVRTNFGGKTFEIDTFSLPLDLPGVGMPTNAPSGTNSGDFAYYATPGLTALISDQFGGVVEPLNNFVMYLDNFRLVDTYDTPNDTPTTYPLQSFENPATPPGGVIKTDPSTNTVISLYTTNDQYTGGGIPNICGFQPFDFVYSPDKAASETDFAVTDGTNCLQVENYAPGYTPGIISISLAGTRLQQITNLNLSPAQLAHYTIRWDVTAPYCNVLSNALDGDYFELDYNATTGSILPMSTGRRQSDGQYGLQRETYSETLDQILYWGTTPAISVSTSLSSNWVWNPFYFDNFRLINTAPKYTVITAQNYNASTDKLQLTWLSEPTQQYTIRFSTTVNGSYATVLAANIASGGDFTTATVTTPGGVAGYVRVLAQ